MRIKFWFWWITNDTERAIMISALKRYASQQAITPDELHTLMKTKLDELENEEYLYTHE